MEVPHLSRWYRRYKKRGLVVLGLAKASAEEQREAKKRFGIPYPLFFWEVKALPPLLRGVKGYPVTLLIDRRGRIREVVFGILFGKRRERFEARLIALLNERAPKVRGKRDR